MRIIFLLMLAGLLAGCSKAERAVQNSFPIRSAIFSRVEIIGARGTGAGEFNKPRSLTCDTNDNLYVADMTGRIQKFSPEGKFLLSWQMPETDIGKAKGMCRDREGNVVVLEPHYQRVNHFTPDGKLVHQWGVKGTNAGELTLPRAIVVDTKGRVIVSEYTVVDRVQIFAPRGERLVMAWGVPGLGRGEFNRAEGVTVDARDNIFVADSCNHRIQVFSPDGKFLRAHGKAGTGVSEFSYPYDIAVDEQGRQFICEFGNGRIQVFDREDHPLETIGKSGGEPGEFANPWSVALDSKGNLYVADSMNHRVQKFIRGPRSKVQGPRLERNGVAGGLGEVRVLSPHPAPLPRGEGERHAAFVYESAPVVTQRWLTGSLSPRERGGVRGNGGPNFSITSTSPETSTTLAPSPR